jgi:hypothetical protein
MKINKKNKQNNKKYKIMIRNKKNRKIKNMKQDMLTIMI